MDKQLDDFIEKVENLNPVVNNNDKLKIKAETKLAKKIKVQVQFLDGETCSRFSNVPAILYAFNPPKEYHVKAQNQQMAFWFKLEEAEYKSVTKQLKPHLKEMTFWLEKEDELELQKFLNEVNINGKRI